MSTLSNDARIPLWMRLAMPEDVAQIAALVDLQYRTTNQRKQALSYELRELRRTQWNRRPTRPARKPSQLRPSKLASGYRHDASMKRVARDKVSAERRTQIARLGATARNEQRSATARNEQRSKLCR